MRKLVLTAIREHGGHAVAVEADLADRATPARLFDSLDPHLAPLDILINNASGWLADTFVPAMPDRLGRNSARCPLTPSIVSSQSMHVAGRR